MAKTRIAESDQYHPRPPGALPAPIKRYARAVLTHEQIQNARRRAAQVLDDAGFVLTDLERDSIEVADFGLSELEQTGLEVVVYVNTPRVCAKELVMFPGQACPEHRHPPFEGSPGKEGDVPLSQGAGVPLPRGSAGGTTHLPAGQGRPGRVTLSGTK